MADGEHKHTVYANKAELPYKHLDNLGRGSYALVDKVETIGSDPQIYARKTIRTRYFRAAAQQKQITSEIKIARRLRHDHIVRLIGTYQAGLDFGIIMSPVADMDLGEYLARADVDSGFYTQMDARCRLHKWIFCLTSAVDYLHGEKIRHKDLKPANILIKGDQIFITDFGISKDLINDATTGSIGFPSERTPMYCAPEANIEDARRGRAADMFSLGCVFLEMWTVASGKSLAEFEEYRIADGVRAYAANLPKVYLWIIHLFNTKRWLSILPAMAALLDAVPERRPRASELWKCNGNKYGCRRLFRYHFILFDDAILPQLEACSLTDTTLPQAVLDGTWIEPWRDAEEYRKRVE